MYKYVTDALKDYEFTYKKSSEYGHIDGYEVNIVVSMMAYGPILHFSTYLTEQKKIEVVNKIKAQKLKLVKAEPSEFGIFVLIGIWTTKSFPKKFKEVLPKILAVLKEVSAPKSDVCPNTGEALSEYNSKLIGIQETLLQVRLSNNASLLISPTKEPAGGKEENAPNNNLKGFGGMLLGVLIGAVAMLFFKSLDLYTALSSAISIFLGIYLYTTFGGKKNIVMLVMSVLITVIILSFTFIYTYSLLG